MWTSTQYRNVVRGSAMDRQLVVAHADLNPSRRLHASAPMMPLPGLSALTVTDLAPDKAGQGAAGGRIIPLAAQADQHRQTHPLSQVEQAKK